MGARIFTTLYLALWVALLLGTQGSLNAQQPSGGHIISIREDRPDLNFVGQFISTPTGSDQFGYLSKIEGISNVSTAQLLRMRPPQCSLSQTTPLTCRSSTMGLCVR